MQINVLEYIVLFFLCALTFLLRKQIQFRSKLKDIKREYESKIDQLAYIDSLTGLPSQRHFRESISNHLKSNPRAPLALIHVDLDRFKSVNDLHGYTKGDQLIEKVANRLREILRPEDVLSRGWGDEFWIYLPRASQEEAVKVIDSIMDSFASPFILANTETYITGTLGISLYPTHGYDYDTLYRNSDKAVHYSKRLGGNTYQFYSLHIDGRLAYRKELERELNQAIHNKELLLYYQPRFSLQTGKITGVEALLRWQHPERGMISPADFIPLAEETGLIVPIGDWVLQTACRQLKKWQGLGVANFRMAINISPRQFQHPTFISTLKIVLEELHVDPHVVEIEITESSLMQNTSEITERLSQVHALGVKISIDDFGTGYSSLAYLKSFPVDYLKIDQSFVRDIHQSQDLAIVTTIVTLAQQLGMKVIAEGVENENQLKILRRLFCHESQGYYFSEPLPAETLERLWLKPHTA